MTKLIYARGRAEKVSLKETYHYELEISRNTSIKAGQAPQGMLEITVPYDGQQFFSRQACADVEYQLGPTTPAHDVDARIGHVLFASHHRTDLKRVLNLSDNYDALPVQVPVVCDDIFQPEDLYDDRHAALLSYAYQPNSPELLPIRIDMQMLDEEFFLELLHDELFRPAVQDDITQANIQAWSRTLTAISQQVQFQHYLVLRIQVYVDLPAPLPGIICPSIKRMSLSWPTITSFRTLDLKIGQLYSDLDDWPIHYNPALQCLEWENISLTPRETKRSDVVTLASEPIWLQIGQPGELYQRANLAGRIEVEIANQVLSGVQMRLYSGTGSQIKSFKPEHMTNIVVDMSLILGDAFARRMLSPYQYLFFDEVIPDPMRIADIRTTLADYGFQIEKERSFSSRPETLHHVLVAGRIEGPHKMQLWVFVDGERYPTERQSELPGGQVYTSTFTSGELGVHMLGQLPGKVGELTRVMNAIQTALCERFARLRAKR